MTNEYVEVVKRWRAGEAVSPEQLRANADRAADAAWQVSVAAEADDYAAYAAASAYAAAASAAAANDATRAEHFIQRYEEMTNDK
tara:strand:- start:76 stop:330 length:255 start_codon:yes stop_codon:yes gene_type:complete